MEELIEAEMVRAVRTLELARYRVRQDRRAFGGVDRDVARRLDAALRQVWHLEERAATALLVA